MINNNIYFAYKVMVLMASIIGKCVVYQSPLFERSISSVKFCFLKATTLTYHSCSSLFSMTLPLHIHTETCSSRISMLPVMIE